MGSKQPSAGLAPVFLRLSLGLVFVWAGLGKVMATMNVVGEDAAILANMGVVAPGAPAAPKPEAPKGEVPKPEAGGSAGTSRPVETHGAPRGTVTAAPDPTGPGVPELMQVVRVSEKAYTAADFPNPVGVKPVYMLALTLKKDASSDKGAMTLWPAALAKGDWPVWTAWAVAWAEIGGGALVLVGLLTRVGAFLLAGVMLGAIWLTQVGPAIQSGSTRLGFLPNHDVFDGQAWQMLLVQFTLLCSAMSLLLAGSGSLSMDRALFGGKADAKPATPKPAA